MTDDETTGQGDGPPDAHQEASDTGDLTPRRPWWALPLAFAGAFAVKYLARRGEEKPKPKPPAPAPPAGPAGGPEQIKDADFKVKE